MASQPRDRRGKPHPAIPKFSICPRLCRHVAAAHPALSKILRLVQAPILLRHHPNLFPSYGVADMAFWRAPMPPNDEFVGVKCPPLSLGSTERDSPSDPGALDRADVAQRLDIHEQIGSPAPLLAPRRPYAPRFHPLVTPSHSRPDLEAFCDRADRLYLVPALALPLDTRRT